MFTSDADPFKLLESASYLDLKKLIKINVFFFKNFKNFSCKPFFKLCKQTFLFYELLFESGSGKLFRFRMDPDLQENLYY